jgi:hypothetical protein
MNILTFDIEDWYLSNPLPENTDWDKYEVRIYERIERSLIELEKHNQKATFFCLGWLVDKHPDAIRNIHKQGHHIGVIPISMNYYITLIKILLEKI